MTRIAITIPLWKNGPLLYVEKGTTTKIAIGGVEKDGKPITVGPRGGMVAEDPAEVFITSSLCYTIEPAGELSRETIRELNLRECREALYKQGLAERPPKKEKKPRKENPGERKGRGKKGKPRKEKKPRFSRETCSDYDQLQALQSKYTHKGKPRIQPNGSGMIFSMEDNRGKAALAVYDGKGGFRPANSRDIRDLDTGTRTVARNKWAARVLAEEWAALFETPTTE